MSFKDFYKENKEDRLKGGRADKMTVDQIADKHGVSVDSIKTQLAKGIEVEREHTTDLELATEIALDHLVELPDYYDRLDDMESQGKAALKTYR